MRQQVLTLTTGKEQIAQNLDSPNLKHVVQAISSTPQFAYTSISTVCRRTLALENNGLLNEDVNCRNQIGYTSQVADKDTRSAASLRQDVARVAKGAGLGLASLGLALAANAANVKLGAEGGGLAFDPSTVTIKAGESVTWTNNVGFPHNVVFDEDDIPVSEYRRPVETSPLGRSLTRDLS